MRREIRFRVWDIKNKKFIKNAVIAQSGDTFDWGEDSDSDRCVLTDIIHSQFTGFSDFEGKEIYEGDIITSEDYDEEWIKTTDRIEWDTDGFWVYNIDNVGFDLSAPLKRRLSALPPNNYKIIGNIYENPELGENDQCEEK